MSFDFSKIAELSTARGKLVELKNSAGRVIWAVKSESGKTVYLRPSADISVDSTIVLTPSTATAAYMLINEELSDAGATTIGVAASEDTTDVSGTAKFNLGGYVPETISRVSDFSVLISADEPEDAEDEDGNPISAGQVFVSFFLNESEIQCGFIQSAWHDGFEGANYSVLEAIQFSRSGYIDVTKEAILAEINEYISANGTLPSIAMEFELRANRRTTTDSGGKNSTTNGYAKVSQAYIVLECE